tara:strand:+ start:1116 stop:1661 length:546 start_codon:yes stop_codon:yes gene_type:complete
MTDTTHWPLTDFIKYDWFEVNDFIQSAYAATEKAHDDANEAFKGLLEEFGATSAVFRGSWLMGLRFDGDAPNGWRITHNEGGKVYYMPQRRKKVDKATHDHITSFKQVTISHFANQFGGSELTQDISPNGGQYLRGCTITKFDGRDIFGIPKGIASDKSFDNIPDDLVPVPLSKIVEVIEA